MVKYTCKSVEETDEHKTAHHFPPYHIGKRLEVERFRGVYRCEAHGFNLSVSLEGKVLSYAKWMRCLFDYK